MSRVRATSMVALAYALALAAGCPTAGAASYSNSAQGYANVFTGLVNNSVFVAGSPSGTGPLNQPSVPVMLAPAPSVAPGITATLAGSAATARLMLAADTLADWSQTDGGGAGTVSVSLNWADTLTLVSSVLPAGSPVSLQFTLVLEGSSALSGDNNTAAHIQDPSSSDIVASLSAGVSLGSPVVVEAGILQGGQFGSGTSFPAGRYGTQGASSVGSSFDLSGGLQSFVVASSSSASPQVHSLLSGTAMAFVSVLTPGVTLESASGHDYAPALTVPESPAAALMGLGLLVLGARVRRNADAKHSERPPGRMNAARRDFLW